MLPGDPYRKTGRRGTSDMFSAVIFDSSNTAPLLAKQFLWRYSHSSITRPRCSSTYGQALYLSLLRNYFPECWSRKGRQTPRCCGYYPSALYKHPFTCNLGHLTFRLLLCDNCKKNCGLYTS